MHLNKRILDALHRKQLGYDFRSTGKTTTLLTFIAVNRPTNPLGDGGPIVVSENMTMAKWTKKLWRTLFPGHDEPRFMSINQHFEGMSGVVFTDGIDFYDRQKLHLGGLHLVDGGGIG
jgi:hypothetical protein